MTKISDIRTRVTSAGNPSCEIFLRGMGTNCTPNDAPIYLEFFEGKWQLIVWADINKENPTHWIDMSGAFESRRNNGNDTIRARS